MTSVSVIGFDPKVSQVEEVPHKCGATLRFNLGDCNVSVANALRRIILAEIPTVVFKMQAQYAGELYNISVNTSRLHNEMIKQRLGCVPIHISDPSVPVEDLEVEVKKRNDSNTMMFVTTEDFAIRNVKTDKYLDVSEVRRIFPPNELTGDYVLLARLRPRISDDIPGEELAFTVRMSYGTSKEDGMYNVACVCSYSMTPDTVEQQRIWSDIERQRREKGVDEKEIETEKKNWYLLDGMRVVLKNSFDFELKSVGVYSNPLLVKMACGVMLKKLETLSQAASSGNLQIEKLEGSTFNSAFNFILKDEDYTLGKVIENIIYAQHYEGSNRLTYVGFIKLHPHHNDSLIRLAFASEGDDKQVTEMVIDACRVATEAFNRIKEAFN